MAGANERPFAGVRVVELAGIGPAPYGVMLLADLGADVIRVERTSQVDLPHELMGPAETDVMSRGRRSIAVDLKHADGLAITRRLVDAADVFVDPFRPGVCERLGLGPQTCCPANPGLVYARMTGWGQEGPLAHAAGHDLNYLAATGALSGMGWPDRPPMPPLNLVADFGGGGMLLAFGVAAALLERTRSGLGQVVDVAMVDGVTSLQASLYGFRAAGRWSDERGSNLLDGGAPFYRTYRTADGRFLSVAALEPAFYSELLRVLGLEAAQWPQHDRERWPALADTLAALFATEPVAHWARRFRGIDACVEPVLSLTDAAEHPQLQARGSITSVAGTAQPAPVPRYSRTPGRIRTAPPLPGADTRAVLADELGCAPDAIERHLTSGAVAEPAAG